MGHFVRTAVEVIGIAVAVAAAIPSGGTSLLAAGLGVSASTASLIAAGTEIAVAGFEAITAKKPTTLANPMDWTSNPEAGVPHIAGRMYFGGQITYRQTWGKANVNETIQTIYSTGPIRGFEGFYVSGVQTALDGTTAAITDRGKMYVSTQLGLVPEPTQLGDLGPPNFTAASKLSGLAASSITIEYDAKGSKTFTTEPNTGFVVLGTPVYDPRKDSTYPGGNGAQRWNDETTWGFAGYDNPGLKALSYLIGYKHGLKEAIGVGLPFSSIIVSQFVEMANVCDANGWTMGGVIFSTDQKWGIFSQILQAGSAEPLHVGALTGCRVNTPKVSLATFEVDDILGDWSVQGTQSRRARINAVVPRYMAEQSVVNETTDSKGNVTLQTVVTWGMATAGAIVVDDYVAFDGGERQKGIDYPFVTGVSTNNMAPNQVAQLARYDIENSREFGPVKLTLKPRWMGYRAGDVITGGASLVEQGLVGEDIMILNRQFSPANYTVSITARSETAAKHPFALGQTTTAPPTPTLTGPPLIPTPGDSAWALVGGTVASSNGTTIPALIVTGAADSGVISAVVFQYRTSENGTTQLGPWIDAGAQAPTIEQLNITGVQDQTAYGVSVAYRTAAGTGDPLILGPEVAGQTAVPWQTGVVGAGKPADGADVTAVVFQALEAGRSPQQVLTDLDAAATATAIEAATAGGWRSQSDQIIYMADGTPVRQTVEQLGITVGGHSAFITTLQEVGGDGSAKYLISVNSDGHIVGMEASSGGGINQLSFVASQFLFVDDSGANPINAMLYSDSVWKMHSIEVDTLKINTAMAPVRVVSGAYVNGSYGGTGFATPRAPVLTAAVVVAVPGWIETTFKFVQGLTGTDGNWSASVAMNGTDDVYSLIADGTSQGNNFTQGNFYCPSAGTYTITGQWAAVPGVQIRERSLFIKFFPKTA